MWIIQLPLHVGINLGVIYLYFEILFYLYYTYLYGQRSTYGISLTLLLFIKIMIVFVFFEYFIYANLYFDLFLGDFFNYSDIFLSIKDFYNFFFFCFLDGDFARLVLNLILKNVLLLIYLINFLLVFLYDFYYIYIYSSIYFQYIYIYIISFYYYYWNFYFNLFDLYFVSLTLAGEHYGMVVMCYLSDTTVEEFYALKAINFMDMGILLSRMITSKKWNWDIDLYSANIYDVVVVEQWWDYPLEGFYYHWVINQWYYFQMFLIFDLFDGFFFDSYIFKYSINLGIFRYFIASLVTFFHYFYTTYLVWVFYMTFYYWFEYYIKIYMVWLFIQYGIVDEILYFYSFLILSLSKIEMYFVCKFFFVVSDVGLWNCIKWNFLTYNKGFYANRFFNSLDDWLFFWAYQWYGVFYMNWIYWVAGYFYDHDAMFYINRCNAEDFPCPYPCKNLPYGFFLHSFLMIAEVFWYLVKYAFSLIFLKKEWLMQLPLLYDKIVNFFFYDYMRVFFIYDYCLHFLIGCNVYMIQVPSVEPLAYEFLVSNINIYEYCLLIFYSVLDILGNIYLYVDFILYKCFFPFKNIYIYVSYYINIFYTYIIYKYLISFFLIIYNNILLCVFVFIYLFIYYLYKLIKYKVDIYVFFRRIFVVFNVLVFYSLRALCLVIINCLFFFLYFFIEFVVYFFSILDAEKIAWFKTLKLKEITKKVVSFKKEKNIEIIKNVYTLDYYFSLGVYMYNIFFNKLVYINIYINREFLNLKKIFKSKKVYILNKSFNFTLHRLLLNKLIVKASFITNIINVATSEGYYFYKYSLYFSILESYFIKLRNNMFYKEENIKGLLGHNDMFIDYVKMVELLRNNQVEDIVKWTNEELIFLKNLTKEMHIGFFFFFYLSFYKTYLSKFDYNIIYKGFLQKMFNKTSIKGLDLTPKLLYPLSLFKEPLKEFISVDKNKLNNIKKNPVVNFLYKDFFFTKKDFLVFYNNTFFDLFSIVLFKKSFSYDFFLKDIFHSTLLTYEENQSKLLSNKKNIFDNSNVFFNYKNTLTSINFDDVNMDLKSILVYLGNLNRKTENDVTILLKDKLFNLGYQLDQIIFEVLYNKDNVIFELLYNKSLKKVPLYSHVNAFFKEIELPKARAFNKGAEDDYRYFFDPTISFHELYKMAIDEKLIDLSGYKPPKNRWVSASDKNLDIENLENRLSEFPELDIFDDYLYLDEYNYVLSMYEDVWSLLYPTDDMISSKDPEDFYGSLPIFDARLVMFEYNYYLSVGLIEYTSCIFFYEYDLECIVYYSLLYLYEIVLFYGYNDFNIFGSFGNMKNAYLSYFMENFYDETITLWDVYFFHLNENLSYLSTNRYLYNRFSMFNPTLSKNHFKYTNDYKFRGYRPITTVDPDDYEYFYGIKMFTYPEYYSENSFLTAYLDLDFYVEYIDVLELSYIQDQKLYFYSTVETSTLNDINLKLINPRFFRYLDSFLLSPLKQHQNININNFLKSPEKVLEDDDYIYEVDDYEVIHKNLDNTVITNEEYPAHLHLEYDDIFKDYSRMLDAQIYVASSDSPFELMQKNMINVFSYMGIQYEYNFTVLDDFLFRFYFDYFFFSLKVLTLNTVLMNEYYLALPNYYVIGPVKEYAQDKTMDLYDGLNFLQTSKLSKRDRISIFYKKFRNFCLDMDYFESFKFNYRFFSFSGVYYYGFFFQFILVCFILFIDSVLYHVNFYMNLKHYEEFSYETQLFPASFVEWMTYAYYEFVLDYEPAEPMDKVFFGMYFPEPFFDMYILRETDEYDGYSDDDHFVASTVFDSLGFNSYLLDVDNRYFTNDGEFSLLYHQATSLTAKLHMNLYFLRDFFFVLLIRLINFIYIAFFLNVFLFIKTLFKCFCLFIEVCLFCFFGSLNFIVIHIKLLLHLIYNLWFSFVLFFLNKIEFLFIVLYYFNLIYIFFFEIVRYSFGYLNSYCFYKFIFFLKKFGFFKFITSKSEVIFYYKQILKRFIVFCFKLLKIIVLILIKVFIIYFLVIFFFDHYDNIIYYIEHYSSLRANYRSMFALQSILFFISFLFLLYPLKIADIVWSIRYWFLLMVAVCWYFSAFINSIDLFSVPLWGVGTTFDLFKKEGLLYGPVFYKRFIHKANYEYVWVQTYRGWSVHDDWIHRQFDWIYTSYLENFAWIRKYLRLLNAAIVRDYGLDLYETKNGLVRFYKLWSGATLDILSKTFESVVNTISPLWKLGSKFWTESNPFNYMFLMLPLTYRESVSLFFSSFLGDSQLDFFFKNYSLVFSNKMNFFTYNYYLFHLTFMQTSMLHLKFFLTEFYSVIPFFGYSYAYYYMYNFGFSPEKVAKFKYLYHASTMNSMKLNMWGEYKPTVNNFFMFYARTWTVVEDRAIFMYWDKALDENVNSLPHIVTSMRWVPAEKGGLEVNKTARYYKLDILTLMEERLYAPIDWPYENVNPLGRPTRVKLSQYQGPSGRIYKSNKPYNMDNYDVRYFTVNQFFTPPYNIELDWQETNNRMFDLHNTNFQVNEPVLYPYNLLVQSPHVGRPLEKLLNIP